MGDSASTLVAVGASAGGVEALSNLVQNLPRDFPGAVLVAVHGPPGESRLPQILTRRGQLPAQHAEDGQTIQSGRILVARPNQHLIVEDSRVRTTSGPRRNGHRPSINALFESVAAAFGSRAVGVILSGALDDGTLGLMRIKQQGGLALVQEPEEAIFTGMPRSALDNVDIDYCARASDIATQLDRLARTSTTRKAPVVTQEEHRSDQVTNAKEVTQITSDDAVAGFVCPECGGALQEEQLGDLIRFRCHVGHEMSERALLNAQAEQVERALWTALRVLEERAELVERAAKRSLDRGNSYLVSHFRNQNQEAAEKAEIIRSVLAGNDQQLPITALQEGHPELVTDED